MTEGFQKIQLDKLIVGSNQVYRKKKNHSKLKFFGGFILAIFVIVFLFIIAILIPAKDLYFSVQQSFRISSETYTVLKNQDIEATKIKLIELEESLIYVEKQLTRLSWMKYIPIIGVYQKDAEHMIKGGISGVQAGEITVDTLVPYSDLLGLKGKSKFVSGSADERIRTAVETLDKVTPRLEDIAKKIAVTGRELDQIDPQRYPEKLGSLPIKSRLILAKDLFVQTAKLFVDAQPFLKKLPDIMGNKEAKTYLVIFQNDAELRATGGFITAYALFKIEKGKMQVVKADDIYKLDEAKNKKFPAPSSIIKYHKNVLTLELRDSNLSPDFVVSMKEFESMLNDSIPGFPKFDGVFAIDTHVLVSTIRVLGDFNIYGRNYSAENDSRCDCPKVIYELEDYSTRPVAYMREDRKDIIGVLLYQIMQRALGVSPSKYWGRLFQVMLEEIEQKHILFYFHNQEAQKGIEALNFAGRILPYEYDYLHINNVNFSGAKSNLFVSHIVKQEINVSDDGTVTKTLVLNYKNPAPPSNCNLEAGQLCLNGILRNWLRLYVPVGSTLIEFTGSEKDTQTYDNLGKTVFEGFFTVKPQGNTEVRIAYKLPFKVEKNQKYKFFIQKQPGTDDDEYQISYKNRQIDKFPLVTDREVTFKM